METYFGDDLTVDRYDELALFKINEKVLAGESELFQSKWFDYRHLHPTQATYLFAAHFTAEYRKMYQKIRDCERGKYITGSKGKDAMDKGTTLGFWKGRQAADKIGMPYGLYIGSAMRFLVGVNTWQRIPNPTQLYSDKVKEFMTTEWVNLLNYDIITPETAHLSDDNAFCIQCKHDIERWLLERIVERKNPHYSLAHFMFEKKLISAETALRYVSSELIERARRFHSE